MYSFWNYFFNDLFLKFYKNDNQYTLLYGDIDGLKKLNDDIKVPLEQLL